MFLYIFFYAFITHYDWINVVSVHIISNVLRKLNINNQVYEFHKNYLHFIEKVTPGNNVVGICTEQDNTNMDANNMQIADNENITMEEDEGWCNYIRGYQCPKIKRSM